VKWYDTELDFIAKKVEFENYTIEHQDLVTEIKEDIQNLPKKIKEPYEISRNLVKLDVENNDIELTNVCEIF